MRDKLALLPVKLPADNTRHISYMISIIFFCAAAFIYLFIYKNVIGLVADSAAEILQIREFKPLPISPFIYAYPGASPIESFYGYFMQPFIWMLGDSVETFHLALSIVFATTAALIFILLKRIFGLSVAILTSIAYVTCAYTIWWPLLLLRNAFSPLLTVGVMLGLLDLYENKPKRGTLLIVIFSFLAINTYSSFKVVIPALLGSAFVAGLLMRDSKLFAKRVFIAGSLWLLLTIVFFISTNKTGLWLRGNYMFDMTDLSKDGSFLNYMKFFIRSFFLPVYENPQGFGAGPTHNILGRPMLNPWLYGVWGVGLVVVGLNIFRKKDPIAFICLATLILSTSILCFGGPSLKTHLALAPIEFIIIAYALNQILKMRYNNKVIITLLTAFVLFTGYLEIRFMFNESSPRSRNNYIFLDSVIGSYLNQHNNDFDFAFSSGANFLLRVYYPEWKYKTKQIIDSEKLDYSDFKTHVGIPEIDQKNDAHALTLRENKNIRIWVIVRKNSVAGNQMMADPNFCFTTYIYEKLDFALFSSCRKEP